MTIQTHSINYQRKATKERDGKDGLLFVHTWPTGWQYLIFANHDAAKRFEADLNRG